MFNALTEFIKILEENSKIKNKRLKKMKKVCNLIEQLMNI